MSLDVEDINTILKDWPGKLSEAETHAILFLCASAKEFGYGSLIAWLNTAWVLEEIETYGIKHKAGVFKNGGHGSSLSIPQAVIDKYKKRFKEKEK